jgi:hypothetical protein
VDFPDDWKQVQEWHQQCSSGSTLPRLIASAMERILPTLIQQIDINQLKPFTQMFSLAFKIRGSEHVINVDAEVQEFKTYCVALYPERSSRPLQQYENVTADDVLPTIHKLAGEVKM